MRILGIDPGNPTGVAIIDTEPTPMTNDSVTLIYYETFYGKRGTEMPAIGQQLETVFRNLVYDAVAIELPHGNIHNAMRSLSEYAGACKLFAYTYGNKPVYRPTPQQGKKELSGSGTTSNDMMPVFAQQRFGIKCDDHVAHAIGYAMAAWSTIQGRGSKTGKKGTGKRKKKAA